MAKGKKEEKYTIYCSACGKTKGSREFYVSKQEEHNNDKLHKHYPMCKSCIKDAIYIGSSGQVNKDAFKKMLEKLNLPFKNDTYLLALSDKRETFGAYISLLNTAYRNRNDMMCWADGETNEKNEKNRKQQIIKNNSISDSFKITQEIISRWGEGYTFDEYEFLENELFEWKKTYKHEKRAEIILLEEICITLLKIRKTRKSDEDVSKLQKDLQDLMKTASIDPAKANIADNGKSLDAFGVWIKDIETKKPAEWWEEQEKYKDMDGFIPYIKNYIVRPIANFLSGNRDFQVNDDIDANLDNIDTEQNEDGENNGES